MWIEEIKLKAKSTPLTSGIVLVNIVLSFIQSILYVDFDGSVETVPIFVLQPAGAFVHFHIWSLATAHFLDFSFLKACLTSILFYLANSKLELHWGYQGNFTYLIFVSVLSSILCSLLIVILFFASSDYAYSLYGADYCGNGALVVSALVGRVHLFKEDKLEGMKLKVRHLVFPWVLLYICCSMFEESFFHEREYIFQDAIFVCFGFPVSYVLLRKFDFSKENTFFTRRVIYLEDDQFTLDIFFPKLMKPLVRSISRGINGIADRYLGGNKQTTTLPHHFSQVGSSVVTESKDLQNISRKVNEVSERRRARALKALDQKLAQLSKEPEQPLDEENEENLKVDIGDTIDPPLKEDTEKNSN